MSTARLNQCDSKTGGAAFGEPRHWFLYPRGRSAGPPPREPSGAVPPANPDHEVDARTKAGILPDAQVDGLIRRRSTTSQVVLAAKGRVDMLTIAVAEREVRFVATLRKGTRVDHRRRYCGFSGLSWPFPLCTATGLMPELV